MRYSAFSGKHFSTELVASRVVSDITRPLCVLFPATCLLAGPIMFMHENLVQVASFCGVNAE